MVGAPPSFLNSCLEPTAVCWSFLYSTPREIICGPGERRRLVKYAFASFWPRLLRERRSNDLFGAAIYEALRRLAITMLAEMGKFQVVERGYIDHMCAGPIGAAAAWLGMESAAAPVDRCARTFPAAA